MIGCATIGDGSRNGETARWFLKTTIIGAQDMIGISDCDRIVAAAGIPKKEVLDKKISPMMEEYMSARKSFIAGKGAGSFCPIDNSDKYASIMYPIISAGDVSGAVVMLLNDRNAIPTETENKLIQAAAAFLGRQMEA